MKTIPSDFLDEGFALPVQGLFADLDSGAGTVQLPDDFSATPPQRQLNLIADWQRGLAQARLRAFERLYDEIWARHRAAGLDEVTKSFQEACRALGQEWPPELAVRLQVGGQAANGSATR